MFKCNDCECEFELPKTIKEDLPLDDFCNPYIDVCPKCENVDYDEILRF